jgi:hypothetical protein
LIQSGTTRKDQVVTVLDLREEQPVLNTGLPTFSFCEERSQLRQPLLTATNQVFGGEGIGEFLQGFRIGAADKGVARLLESNASLSEPIG